MTIHYHLVKNGEKHGKAFDIDPNETYRLVIAFKGGFKYGLFDEEDQKINKFELILFEQE